MSKTTFNDENVIVFETAGKTQAQYEAELANTVKRNAGTFAVAVNDYAIASSTGDSLGQSHYWLRGRFFEKGTDGPKAYGIRLIFAEMEPTRGPRLMSNKDGAHWVDVNFGYAQSAHILHQLAQRHCYVIIDHASRPNVVESDAPICRIITPIFRLT